jgi:hypothetical protein
VIYPRLKPGVYLKNQVCHPPEPGDCVAEFIFCQTEIHFRLSVNLIFDPSVSLRVFGFSLCDPARSGFKRIFSGFPRTEGVSPMVNYCANPICHKPLHYLREGKVFLFSRKNPSDDHSKLHRLEHYWLCGICAKEWTLTSDAKGGVKLVETRRRRVRAGYSMPSIAPAS